MTNNTDLTYRAFVDISDQALMYADRPAAVVVAAMNRLTQTIRQVGTPRECVVRVHRVHTVYAPLGSVACLFDGIRITANARYDPLPRPRWVRQHYGGRYHLWHRVRLTDQHKSQCGVVDIHDGRAQWADGQPTGRVCKRCADRSAV